MIEIQTFLRRTSTSSEETTPEQARANLGLTPMSVGVATTGTDTTPHTIAADVLAQVITALAPGGGVINGQILRDDTGLLSVDAGARQLNAADATIVLDWSFLADAGVAIVNADLNFNGKTVVNAVLQECSLLTSSSAEITNSSQGLILKSPNGTRFLYTSNNDGSLNITTL